MKKTNVNQTGFSLLEVLIALLILSIGLLGIAGLQVTSKRTNFDAVQRTTATMLALEMLERIRANASQLDVYTNTGAGRTFTPAAGITYPAAEPDCEDDDCTAAELADYDLYQWQEALAGVSETSGGNDVGGLAVPTACITGAAATTSSTGNQTATINIAIAWRGMLKLSDPTINTCGNATGLYGDGTTDNVFRRVLEIDATVTETN